MRKLATGIVALVAVTLGASASAQSSRDTNLAGKTLCLAADSAGVYLPAAAAVNVSALQARLMTELERRLTLSRVRFERSTTGCDIYVSYSFEMTQGASLRAFTSQVEVSDFTLPGYSWVTIWANGGFGYGPLFGAALETFIFDDARTRFEQLALAWIKANP